MSRGPCGTSLRCSLIFPVLQTGHNSSTRSCVLLLAEKLAEIEHGQRTWDLDSLADLKDRKIPTRDFRQQILIKVAEKITSDLPATDQADETKATSNSQQHQDVRQLGRASHNTRHSSISSGDESEQEDEAEEEADK
jgi:hypothetical protein